MKRENCSREEVLVRMNKQWSDEDKMKLADFVINNDECNPILTQLELVLAKLIDNFN